MNARVHARVGFLVAASIVIAAAACGTVADLDVDYRSVETSADGGAVDPVNVDGGGGGVRTVRDSSFDAPDESPPVVLDPSDAGPCNPTTDPDGGCDFSQGLGCCIRSNSDSECIFQWEIATKCQNSIFVGCREDDPLTESACCWRAGPGNARMSVLGASCDGGTHACVADGGACANGGTCSESTCNVAGGGFTIGSCGPTAEVCP